MSELKKCPICHEQAKIGYACGDYFAYCSDGCPSPMCDHASESTTVCAWNDWEEWCEKNRRAQPENEPLTVDEMNALDHEPIYVLHTGGKWTMNGWHIATASSYQNHGRCDLKIDNGNTTIDMQNYGKIWLAYRRKPERSELDA